MPFNFSLSTSISFVSTSSVNGETNGWAYRRESYNNNHGSGVRTARQRLGEAPVTQTRMYDAQGRPLLPDARGQSYANYNNNNINYNNDGGSSSRSVRRSNTTTATATNNNGYVSRPRRGNRNKNNNNNMPVGVGEIISIEDVTEEEEAKAKAAAAGNAQQKMSKNNTQGKN